jgi:glucose-1-phosphate cytidylyltransferase
MSTPGMKVVILCGGLGTRLREETEFRPKPMVPIGNRPILWHIMKFYAHFGYKEFILCLGYKGDVIREYFHHYQWYNNDVTLKLGAKPQITYHTKHTEEEWKVTLLDTGQKTLTGGRVRRALEHIPEEEFLLTYGDGVCDLNLEESIRFHRKEGVAATITAVRPTGRFGELSMEGNSIFEFREKPETESGYVNGGFFVLNRSIAQHLGTDESSFEFDALPKIAASNNLRAFRHEGFWQCMDNLREVETLNKLWNEGRAPWKVWKD